jgi:hypothetical protein
MSKNKIEIDLSSLERFEDQWMLLKKIDSKRPSRVDVGQFTTGDFSLVTIPESSEGPEGKGACVSKGMTSYLRTSPIIKIVDQDEKSTTFETEGGFYKLEKV